MTTSPLARSSTLAVVAIVLGVASPVMAQSTPAKKSSASASAPAASAPARKPAPARATKKAPPPPKVVAELPPPAPATPEQIEASERVYYGVYDCEFKQTINIVASPKYGAYVEVKHGKADYLMKPVLSSTGAIRLEDVRGETLMVQIASKSMLLNVVTAQRIVDECVSPRQRELIEAARLAKAAAIAAAAASAAGAVSASASASAPGAMSMPPAVPAPTSTPAAEVAPAASAAAPEATRNAVPASGAAIVINTPASASAAK